MSIANLEKMYALADAVDIREGRLAYSRYHMVMNDLAELYSIPIGRVIAGFVALSPNNDYLNNLRSLVTLLHGLQHNRRRSELVVSTYGHCGNRAWSYLTGATDFLQTARGLKIRSFYNNVLDPLDNRYVTVDGHVCATYRGKNLTMKEAIIKSNREYREIADAIKGLAFSKMMLPNEYQATIWFTRKRVFKIRAELQFDLLLPSDDVWHTYRDVRTLKPFVKSELRKVVNFRRSEQLSLLDMHAQE